MRFSTLSVLLVLSACRQGGTKPIGTDPGIADPRCGDGRIDDGEECDGAALGEKTCKSLGFDDGQLACDSSCKLVKTLCTKHCGNGVIDVAESCDGDAGVTACATFGYHACSPACQLEVAHCVSTSFETGPAFFMAKGGATAIGDLAPTGPRDLVMAVPSFARVETFPWLLSQGFQQSQGRKLSFENVPLTPWVADLNADGIADVVTINDSGSIDLLQGKTSGYTRVPASTQLCPGGRFLGSRGTTVALSCGSVVLIIDGAVTKTIADAATSTFVTSGDLWLARGSTAVRIRSPEYAADAGTEWSLGAASPSQLAVGDFDRDGDEDLAAVEGNSVTVFENTGFDFAVKNTWPAMLATALHVIDIDLDGRLDVLWVSGSEVVIRRNNSAFVFTEFKLTLASIGPRLSTSVGDVDGDGDSDVVVTVSEGGDATRTDVHLNRVR